MAGVGLASVPGPGPGQRSRLQRDPDQPLLGPHVGVLHQQVTRASPSAALTVPPSHLWRPLQVRRRLLHVCGAGRRLGADPPAGAGGASPEVQGAERRPRSGFAEAPQLKRSLPDL